MTVSRRSAPDVPRVVLAHDYLTEMGGAERVVVRLVGRYPDAPLLTAAFRPGAVSPGFAGRDVHTSFLDRLAGRQGPHPSPVPAAAAGLPLDARATVRRAAHQLVRVRPSPAAGRRHAARLVLPHAAAVPVGARRLLPRPPGPARGPARPRWPSCAGWTWVPPHASTSSSPTRATPRDASASVYGRDAPVLHPPVPVDGFRPRRSGPGASWSCRGCSPTSGSTWPSRPPGWRASRSTSSATAPSAGGSRRGQDRAFGSWAACPTIEVGGRWPVHGRAGARRRGLRHRRGRGAGQRPAAHRLGRRRRPGDRGAMA